MPKSAEIPLVSSFLVVLCFLFLFMTGDLVPKVEANETAPEKSTTLLIIHADSGDGGDDFSYEFSRQELEALPQKTVATKTPWTDGISEFSGPLLRDVLQIIGRSGPGLRCTALNDYSITIPIEDTEKYSMILAMRRDGKNMSTRDKGPLWVIYPWSDNESLWKETYFGRSIWQLRVIEILP